MRCHVLLALLGLSWICVAVAQVSYDDCCLKYVRTMNAATQKHALRYRVQETNGGCNIAAIIFTMRRGRVYCTDPSERWVQDLRKKIDKRRKRNKTLFHRQQVNKG